MSNEEQMAAIGRTVTEAAESRKRASLLQGELESLSESLHSASLHINGLIQGIHNPDLHQAIHGIPTAEKVLSTYEAFQRESERAKALKARVASLGI